MRTINKPLRTAALIASLAVPATTGLVLAASSPASAGPCTWQVIADAQVRETPSINSVVRKTKAAGSYVSGACGPRTGTDGRAWVAVDCTCATDGVGYIIYDKLRQPIYA